MTGGERTGGKGAAGSGGSRVAIVASAVAAGLLAGGVLVGALERGERMHDDLLLARMEAMLDVAEAEMTASAGGKGFVVDAATGAPTAVATLERRGLLRDRPTTDHGGWRVVASGGRFPDIEAPVPGGTGWRDCAILRDQAFRGFSCVSGSDGRPATILLRGR